MRAYLNPGGEGVLRIINGTYIDKTGLLGLINRAIGTTKNLDLHKPSPSLWQVVCGSDAMCLL